MKATREYLCPSQGISLTAAAACPGKPCSNAPPGPGPSLLLPPQHAGRRQPRWRQHNTVARGSRRLRQLPGVFRAWLQAQGLHRGSWGHLQLSKPTLHCSPPALRPCSSLHHPFREHHASTDPNHCPTERSGVSPSLLSSPPSLTALSTLHLLSVCPGMLRAIRSPSFPHVPSDHPHPPLPFTPPQVPSAHSLLHHPHFTQLIIAGRLLQSPLAPLHADPAPLIPSLCKFPPCFPPQPGIPLKTTAR